MKDRLCLPHPSSRSSVQPPPARHTLPAPALLQMVACGRPGPGNGAGSLPQAELPGCRGQGALPCCGAASRAGSQACCFLRLPFPSRFQWPPGASPLLSRSMVFVRGVCLSLLAEQIPLWPHKECFGGHEPFSINKQLRAPPSAACRTSSSHGQPGGAVPATSPLRATAVTASSCKGLSPGQDKPCLCHTC